MFADFVSFIFIYFIIYWIVIFMVLPFGVKTDDNPQEGNDSGAPKNVNMKNKFIVTGIVALVITLTVIYFQDSLLTSLAN